MDDGRTSATASPGFHRLDRPAWSAGPAPPRPRRVRRPTPARVLPRVRELDERSARRILVALADPRER
jgi:hypothetical protein